MIQVNLVPDVKQELLRAQKVRSLVISASVLACIVAGGIVALLVVYVYLVQFGRGVLSDNTIKDQSAKLLAVEDIDNTLTVQNQLIKVSETHKSKPTASRIFNVVRSITPSNVSVSKLTLDDQKGTVTLEAQSNGGYAALETFKKTISATKLEYSEKTNGPEDGSVDPEVKSIELVSDLADTETSFGEDADGKKVLRFTISFKYPEQLFKRDLSAVAVIGPKGKTDVTDSFLGIPSSLFDKRVKDIEEGEE